MTGFEHVKGPTQLVMLPLDSTSADIEPGTAITASGGTDGYYKEADAKGEALIGIAVNKVSSPAADGGAFVKVNVCREAIYAVGLESGSVAVTHGTKACDVGTDGISVSATAVTGAGDIDVVKADVDNDRLYVRINSTFSNLA